MSPFGGTDNAVGRQIRSEYEFTRDNSTAVLWFFREESILNSFFVVPFLKVEQKGMHVSEANATVQVEY